MIERFRKETSGNHWAATDSSKVSLSIMEIVETRTITDVWLDQEGEIMIETDDKEEVVEISPLPNILPCAVCGDALEIKDGKVGICETCYSFVLEKLP